MPYTPKSSVPLDSITAPQIRLLLMGRPGTGKTFSIVTTFPDVVVADFDSGLSSPDLKGKGTLVLPFYDEDWAKKTYNTNNARDAFKIWLNTEARKLEAGQTLFIDSLSAIAAAFHKATEPETPASKDGKENGFYVWNEKMKYFRDIHIIIRSLKCHVVVAAHENEERDPDSGILLGKVTPLMSGSFVKELGRHYSDIFRACSTSKKKPDGTPTNEVVYLWQVLPDERYDLKSRIKRKDKFIAPGFSAFAEYFTPAIPGTPNAPIPLPTAANTTVVK